MFILSHILSEAGDFVKKAIITILIMCCFITPIFANQIVGIGNFEKALSYEEGMFVDISKSDWFEKNVVEAYEYGLMNGTGAAKFNPNTKLTLAESTTLAVRINYIYYNGESIFLDVNEDSAWYEPYVSYATVKGILTTTYPDYTAVATRADFAKILAASIDSIDLQPINIVDDGAIPDVDMNSDYADAAYLLYRAGVLTGSDESGTFNPDSTISRAEAAAIITRIVDPGLRKTITLTGDY